MNKARLIFFFVLFLLSQGVYAQKLALSTNVLDYANMGTLNLDVSYALAQHWNLRMGAKYNPFLYDSKPDNARFLQRSVSLGGRYWPWHIFSGGWIGANVRYQEYNSGMAGEVQTSEGDRFGGGISGGYSLMLSPHLNLDFGIGFWTGYELYTVYACRSCGRILSGGAKYFFLPDDILLSLSYIF